METPKTIRKVRKPQTPYTIKALKIRADNNNNNNNAATPRRRSTRRRTPRDDLRILSRALAQEQQEKREKQAEQARKKSIEKQKEKERRSMVVAEEEDQEIVVPIDGDDDEEENAESNNTFDKTEVPEVQRRWSGRLSLANPRISDTFEFPANVLLSAKRKSISQDEPLVEEDDTVNIVPEDSFRIQFDDDKFVEEQVEPMDTGEMEMNNDDYGGFDFDGNDEQQEGLVAATTNNLSSSSSNLSCTTTEKLKTALPRKTIKDALKSMTNSRITPETLDSIIQESDNFFDQLTSDLSEYASHAHRKTIDSSDVSLLMKRIRLVDDDVTTPFMLAHKRRLPAELLENIQ